MSKLSPNTRRPSVKNPQRRTTTAHPRASLGQDSAPQRTQRPAQGSAPQRTQRSAQGSVPQRIHRSAQESTRSAPYGHTTPTRPTHSDVARTALIRPAPHGRTTPTRPMPSNAAPTRKAGSLPAHPTFPVGVVRMVALVLVALLAVWAVSHIATCQGGQQSQGRPAYRSASIINQVSPAGVPLQKDAFLVQMAEQRQRSLYQTKLDQRIQAQRQHIANLDLSKRNERFCLGAPVPDIYESNGRKTVYLTFDDGPSPVTRDILDILDRYGVKATFFVTNIMPEHQALIAETYRRGHTIGLHTSTHDFAQVYASIDAYFADLDAVAQTVKNQIGYVPCFIRFAGGSSNSISANYTPGIMSELSWMVQERGYQYYDWNCENGDATGNLPATQIINLATNLSPEMDQSNLVMLLHDAQAKGTTADALPAIIEHYLFAGYVFEPLTPTTKIIHHPIYN